MKSLSWIFKLFDQFSGPAGKIERAIRRMGVAQAQAMAMDERRTRAFELATRRMGIAQSQASAMDERRSAQAERRIRRMGALQTQAAATDERRTRRMGTMHAQAIVEDQRRTGATSRVAVQTERATRRMGTMHAQATAMDERRTSAAQRAANRQIAAQQRVATNTERVTRRMGALHAQALTENERRTRRMGTLHAQAIKEDERRSRPSGRRGSGIMGLGMGIAGYYVAFRAVTAMARTVARAATAIPRAVIGGGIEHTAMKESAVAGMGIVLGNEGLAAKLVKQSVRFAAVTPMTTEESMKGYQQLIMGGIAPNKVLGVMSAVSDLSSMNMARRSEAVETIAQDLMQIQSAGKVDGRHLRNLSHWGLPKQELLNQLTQIIPALHGATPDVVLKAVSAGKISADAFFLAFERAMAVKGGGKLGGISEKQSGTMLGLWSTLISRPQELLMNMDKTPAWGHLKTALGNLVNATDYNSPTGSKIQEALSSAFGRWVDKLTGWLQDPEKVTAFIDRLLGSFEKLVPLFESMVGVIPPVIEGLTRLGSVFEFLHLASKVPTPANMGAAPGALGSAWEYVKGAAKGGRGWELFPAATWNSGRAVPPSGPKKISSSSTTANVHVNVNGATREDAKVVGHEVRSQVADMFEQMGIEIGAASGVR